MDALTDEKNKHDLLCNVLACQYADEMGTIAEDDDGKKFINVDL